MQITFSPQVRSEILALDVAGSVLTLNGVAVDLALYDAGAAPNDGIVGQPVQTEDGTWQVTVLLPIGAGASEAARFPEAVTVEAGAVPVPV